jgi:hypothetical protein
VFVPKSVEEFQDNRFGTAVYRKDVVYKLLKKIMREREKGNKFAAIIHWKYMS